MLRVITLVFTMLVLTASSAFAQAPCADVPKDEPFVRADRARGWRESHERICRDRLLANVREHGGVGGTARVIVPVVLTP